MWTDTDLWKQWVVRRLHQILRFQNFWEEQACQEYRMLLWRIWQCVSQYCIFSPCVDKHCSSWSHESQMPSSHRPCSWDNTFPARTLAGCRFCHCHWGTKRSLLWSLALQSKWVCLQCICPFESISSKSDDQDYSGISCKPRCSWRKPIILIAWFVFEWLQILGRHPWPFGRLWWREELQWTWLSESYHLWNLQ